jgi:hypothetical protein
METEAFDFFYTETEAFDDGSFRRREGTVISLRSRSSLFNGVGQQGDDIIY